MKKFLIFLLAVVLAASMAACNQKEATDAASEPPESTAVEVLPTGKLVVLFTADVHNAYRQSDSGTIGYAALSKYRNRLEDEGNTVLLIDGGDALSGGSIGTLSNGIWAAELMDAAGYDLAVPGVQDLDYGLDAFLELAQKTEYEYICCNWLDQKTGEPLFAPYAMVEAEGMKIAFVGVVSPQLAEKIKDDRYDFCGGNDGQALYDAVQNAIDDARTAGAEYIFGVGHLGIDLADSPWSASEVIENTVGLTAFFDAKSHAVLDDAVQEDEDLNEIPLISAGVRMEYVAQLSLQLDSGAVEAELITQLEKEDSSVLEVISDMEDEMDALMQEPIAVSDVDLLAFDPDDASSRLITSEETNLGDLCADAYRQVLDADVALVLGSGIWDDIPSGRITWQSILDVYPFSRQSCVVRVKGQTILNALEFSCQSAGEESFSGFLQVSGIQFDVDTTVASGVRTDEDGNYIGVAQGIRRVKNVMVGEEPLDPDGYYTVASNDYLLRYCAEGYTMFRDAEVVERDAMLDHQVLYRYLCENLAHQVTEAQYKKSAGRINIK